MPVARVSLAITLTVNDACDAITLTDSTGTYNATTNPLGYGLPTGATSASVTGLVIVVTLSDGSYLTYTFTIASNVISACTLGLSGATATAITANLASTVFPLTSFDLFDEDYGPTMPTIGDGIYTVDYTITGRIDPASADTAYSYTTSKTTGIFCDLCCCLSEKALDIDPDCSCFDEKMMLYLRASMYGKISKYALNVGKNAEAIVALDKATELCDCECQC